MNTVLSLLCQTGFFKLATSSTRTRSSCRLQKASCQPTPIRMRTGCVFHRQEGYRKTVVWRPKYELFCVVVSFSLGQQIFRCLAGFVSCVTRTRTRRMKHRSSRTRCSSMISQHDPAQDKSTPTCPRASPSGSPTTACGLQRTSTPLM